MNENSLSNSPRSWNSRRFGTDHLDVLSGGELQRVAVAAALSREADVYLFDEPSSYLDVKQRLVVAKAIRSLKEQQKTIVVAEHDLAIIDYLSDQICVFYGEPGVYGVVSHTHGVRTGINIYLQGYIPDENIMFRKEAIIFHEKPPTAGTKRWRTPAEMGARWRKPSKASNSPSNQARYAQAKSSAFSDPTASEKPPSSKF